MDINAILVDLCNKELFPILVENNLHCKIISILVYGSRSDNGFHEKSDIDALVLVESNQLIDVDFDGSRKGLCVDLKVCDLKTTLNYIHHGHLSFAINLESCICVYGDALSRDRIVQESKQSVGEKTDILASQIQDDDFDHVLSQAEHQLNNYRHYFLSTSPKSIVAFHGRLFELIYDYVRLFIRLYFIYTKNFDAGGLKLLLCLESFKRQACYLEVLRKDWFPPVTELINSITAWDWHSVGEAINKTHEKYFGDRIIKDSNPHDILLIKEGGVDL